MYESFFAMENSPFCRSILVPELYRDRDTDEILNRLKYASQKIQNQIHDIYHDHNGTDGYRRMQVYLERAGYTLSRLTVHKYMNQELGLYSIVWCHKPDYKKRDTG